MVKTLLAIETSCDETSIAIIRAERLNEVLQFKILSHLILSQAEMHTEYGGVYPNLARREHQNNIISLIAEALDKAELLSPNINDIKIDPSSLIFLDKEKLVIPAMIDFLASHGQPDIDAIAVTSGPGLEPALWVGINVAKTLANYWNIPLLPINHMEGHIYSVFANGNTFSIPSLNYKALALLISGGHTELVLINNLGEYQKIGQTRDDAVGEAFDKVARLLSLSYPGGPAISKLALQYNSNNCPSEDFSNKIVLPRPMLHSPDYDFSFAGLKTAVLYLINSLPKPLSEQTKSHIAHEFESAVVEVLTKKTQKAIDEYGINTLIVAGGVANNTKIRESIGALCQKMQIKILLPTKELSMDNALMISLPAMVKFFDPNFIPIEIESIKANGNWSL